ncbi:MAG: flagellar motor protein MotB [Thermodesulfobacteriota bacterium]|nr:flagellar motor protein MotB [Thermodesulfobacteriota bacterium]
MMSGSKLSDLEEIAQTDARGAWLLTYADLITLILVFFILLFALSKKEAGIMADALKSYEIAIGKETPKTSLFNIIDKSLSGKRKKLDQQIGLRDVDLFKEINSLIKKKNLGGKVEAEVKKGDIIFRVQGSVFFKSGSADLLPEVTHIFSDIIQIMKNYPQYDVDIQGHTDNRSISTAKFTSNWELSAIRATTVLRYLIKEGIPAERLTATGFADLRPLADNDTPVGRKKNRRVEFVLKEKE